jgi:hypothetical protein
LKNEDEMTAALESRRLIQPLRKHQSMQTHIRDLPMKSLLVAMTGVIVMQSAVSVMAGNAGG